MQAYTLNRRKYKFLNGNHPLGGRGGSKQDKLITRNANRGLKKAYRQHLKLLIRAEIDLWVIKM
jgi:hypothetical protein